MASDAQLSADLCAIAITAAKAGAQAIREVTADGGLWIKTKSDPADLVTAADTASEGAIIDVIHAARPFDEILAEESGHHPGTSGIRWVVDPLDGTRNFLSGGDRYAVSIGVIRDSLILASIIFRPIDQMWLAASGQGVSGSYSRYSLSAESRFSNARVAYAFPNALESRRAAVAHLLADLHCVAKEFADTGSTASDLLDVALGRREAYVGFDMPIWDTLAGRGLVEGVGGHCIQLELPQGMSVFIAGVPAATAHIYGQIQRSNAHLALGEKQHMAY